MLFETLENRRLMTVSIAGAPIVIYGTSGDDTIQLTQSGTTLNVVYNGLLASHSTSAFKVVVYGSGGNDKIWAGSSVQLPLEIYGGAGNDSIRGGAARDNLFGGMGGTLTAYESGRDTLDGAGGNDRVQSSAFTTCYLYGGANNDTLIGGSQTDYIYGLDGDDRLDGMGGADYLYGGAGADWLEGDDANDYLYGSTGNDTLRGNAGHDALFGDQDNDLLDGMDGNDTLYGSTGRDDLRGAAGNDLLRGDAGNDTLNGGAHNDQLYGGTEDDWMVADAGSDRISGELGWDTVYYGDRVLALSITQDNIANDGEGGEGDNVTSDVDAIVAGLGNDLIVGSDGNNWLEGGSGHDTIRGAGGDDTIVAGWGDDVLYGQAGHDSMWGYYGDDWLSGGAGDDSLHGEGGEDTLVAVGGGAHDQLFGGSDVDGFWMDAELTETHDADSTENNSRCVHRVFVFANGASKELNGQNLPDPTVEDSFTEMYTSPQPTANNPLFSSAGPDEDDVDQGGLGDCWFLATLSAVAKSDPDIIRQSVVDLGDGTYAAMFFDGGERRYYRVDNQLPVNRNMATLGPSNNLAYAQPGVQGAMWVPILEKAYALHDGDAGGEGSYAELSGGWSDNAFSDMGVGSADYDVDDNNVLQLMANYLAAGRPITLCTISGDFNNGDNLVLSHCYTVTSISTNSGTITLRNPWATDAGNRSGAWVQGANDGYVTFTWNQWFRDMTDYFTVGAI
jgi:Ca2+-binding RTX toxin-like protein